MEVGSAESEVNAVPQGDPETSVETAVVAVDSSARNAAGSPYIGIRFSALPTEASKAGNTAAQLTGPVIHYCGQGGIFGNGISGSTVSMPMQVAEFQANVHVLECALTGVSELCSRRAPGLNIKLLLSHSN